MLDQITATLTLCGPATEVSKILAIATREMSGLRPASKPGKGEEVITETGANSGLPISLNAQQFRRLYEGVSPAYQKGLRLLTRKGGTVSYEELVAQKITNPGHFKSRLNLRAKTVLGLTERVQLVTYSREEKNGYTQWYLNVKPETLVAMKEVLGV